jgi:hypothetical protein
VLADGGGNGGIGEQRFPYERLSRQLESIDSRTGSMHRAQSHV